MIDLRYGDGIADRNLLLALWHNGISSDIYWSPHSDMSLIIWLYILVFVTSFLLMHVLGLAVCRVCMRIAFLIVWLYDYYMFCCSLFVNAYSVASAIGFVFHLNLIVHFLT